jgi:hypothetical protein
VDSVIGGLASGALVGHFQGAFLCALFLLTLNSRERVDGFLHHNIAHQSQSRASSSDISVSRRHSFVMATTPLLLLTLTFFSLSCMWFVPCLLNDDLIIECVNFRVLFFPSSEMHFQLSSQR